MPILKPISGHTGLAKTMDYLERDGRALARDFLNLDAPELPSDDPLPSYGEFDWASAMDATRAELGNDAAWGDRRARTYKHYIVSPDPRDAASLSTLRSVTLSWVTECFPAHEVAIVYHDDNDGHVLHAHVIVNNTNLETGRRLRDPDPRELKRRLQHVSAEHGLSRLPDEDTGPLRRRSVGRAERELTEKGEYSWVADIRDRVAIARSMARNEGDFVAAMGRMGVVVEPSRSRKGDWVYSLAETSTRRVTGTRLGSGYTRRGIRDWVRNPTKRHATPKTAEKVILCAGEAIEVKNLKELRNLARAVSFASATSCRSLRELDAAIAHTSDPERSGRLREMRFACERYGLLPERAKPRQTPGAAETGSSRRSSSRNGYAESSPRHYEQSRPSRGRSR